MIIKKIRIKNFRSINDIQIDLSDLTVIMGDNDAGKSNILRAINLFFNSKTDGDRPFYFQYDWNHNAIVPANKAKEILIDITFIPPENYQHNKEIIWRKVWRRDGEFISKETRRFIDGTEISARSKINTWLSRIKFKYVPATKGADYFSQLLGELHDTLSNTVDEEIKAAAEGFTSKINEHTKSIFNELDGRLGIKSSIQLPSDLKILFTNLDFQADKNRISLQQRGDGIKARHIPIILRFLADQDNALRDRGSAKYNHIWGYEEPENNLELTKSYALAEEFVEYSSAVQIILTTHSPAFYCLHKNGANIHYISKNVDTFESMATQVDLTLVGKLDELMGVMPLVAPYVETAIFKYKELLAQADLLSKDHVKKPTLFVEGPSDVAILKKAFQVFAPETLEKIKIRASGKHGGGEGWVTDMVLAWLHNREEIPAAGLYDSDEQGKIGKAKVTGNQKYEGQVGVRVFSLKAPSHLRRIFHIKLKIGLCLEETLSLAAWRHAETEGWLEQRANLVELNPDLAKNFEISVDQSLNEKQLSSDELLYVRNIVRIEKKETFSKYIEKLNDEDALEILAGLRSTITDIALHLNPQEYLI